MRRYASRRVQEGPVGPVDQVQLQEEMRHKALLANMKNKAWAGTFNHTSFRMSQPQ